MNDSRHWKNPNTNANNYFKCYNKKIIFNENLMTGQLTSLTIHH